MYGKGSGGNSDSDNFILFLRLYDLNSEKVKISVALLPGFYFLTFLCVFGYLRIIEFHSSHEVRYNFMRLDLVY